MEAIIILAGGSGTRLWPASTTEKPKQFLSLGTEGKSFLRMSVERGLAVNPEAEVVVVTHRDYLEDTAGDLAEYSAGGRAVTILPEPMGKNTAPAILFAAHYLAKKLPETATALILSADHLIRPRERFVEDAHRAALLGRAGYITVFGIPPTEANTGYGYIEAGEPLSPGVSVKAFKEKPDAKTAEGYVASGRHFWNSGMFLFSLKTLFEEFGFHAPELAAPFGVLAGPGLSAEPCRRLRGTGVWGEGEVIEKLYRGLPSISVDYAVLEKSRKVAMIRGGFEWNDVGSWDEVARLYPDEGPRILSVEAEGNSVFSDIPVALCGVRDLIVVVRSGKALVLKKGSSQLVREAARDFEKSGSR